MENIIKILSKDDYYKSQKNVTVYATETRPGPDGDETINNFTAKAEGEWTKKELEDLCPPAKWDAIFASQYDSAEEHEGYTVVQSFSNSTGNRIDIGGGHSYRNAATSIKRIF